MRMSYIVTVPIVILFFHSVITAAGRTRDLDGSEPDLVELICKNKKVRVSSVSVMKKVIMTSLRNREICRDYQPSLNELEPILSIEDGNHCTSEAFELISAYHFRFILPPKRLNKRPDRYTSELEEPQNLQLHPEPHYYTVHLDEHDEPLIAPLAVRHFFLAFALQISGICKKGMLAHLKLVQQEKNVSKDERSILSLLTYGSELKSFMKEKLQRMDFDNVLYMPELEGHWKSLGEADYKTAGKKVIMQTSVTESSVLYELMMDCRVNLRPVYMSSIMPVIKLSKLGYDYRGPKLTEDERAHFDGLDIKTWLGIVHVCEMFHGFLVVQTEVEEQLRNDEDDLDNFELEDERKGVACSQGDCNAQAADHGSEKVPPVTRANENRAEPLEDGHLKLMSAEDMEKLECIEKVELPASSDEFKIPIEPVGDRLWVLGTKELDLELSRKPGHAFPLGWRGRLRRMISYQKKLLSKLDFNQANFWRKSGLWYLGVFNVFSVCLSLTNIAITILIKVGVIG